MRNLIPYLLVLFVIALPSQAAEYYTWIDENGVTNYSERNPNGYDAEHITKTRRFGERVLPRSDPQPTNAPATGTNSSTTGQAGADPDAVIEKERAALAAEIAETKRKNCNIGKQNLAQLEAFARIRVSDEKGENRIITDDEKATRVTEARQVIRENCTG